MIEALGYKTRVSTTYESVLIAYFANTVFPRLGEVTRCGTITKKEVDLLCIKQIESVIFELTDHLASRKIDKAIEQWEMIYKQNKAFRDVTSKLSEYKALQSNDYLKDYLTCSNEEFILICKNAIEKNYKLQIMNCDLKKWGCQLTGVDKRDEAWMAVKKQLFFIRFYREPEPIDDAEVRQSLDEMKSLGSVKGFLFSSSGFSNSAKRFAENRPVELAEKQKLEAILSKAGE